MFSLFFLVRKVVLNHLKDLHLSGISGSLNKPHFTNQDVAYLEVQYIMAMSSKALSI